MDTIKYQDLDLDLINEWTKRLRSGNYRQIRGSMHSLSDGYCGLGVLATILEERGLLTKYVGESGVWIYRSERKNVFGNHPSSTGDIPTPLHSLGLPVYYAYDAYSYYPIQTLNDVYELSFDKLADSIDRTVEQIKRRDLSPDDAVIEEAEKIVKHAPSYPSIPAYSIHGSDTTAWSYGTYAPTHSHLTTTS